MIRKTSWMALLAASMPVLAWAASASQYAGVILPEMTGLSYTMAVDDLNGDDNLDILASNHFPPKSLKLFLGDGTGGFAAPVTLLTDVSDRVFTGFVNSDAYPDVIATRFSTGDILILINNGDGTFAAPTVIPGSTTQAEGLATGYLNTDPYLDLVLFGGPTRVYLGDGTGNLAPSGAAFPLSGNTHGGGILDCNSDGSADLVVHMLGAVWMLLGDGTGAFTISDSASVGNAWGAQALPGEAIIDFNEDGHPDILVADPLPPSAGPSKVHVLFTDGQGSFSGRTTVELGGACYGLTALDYDYDGHLDLAASSTASARITVFFGDGSGAIRDSVSFPTDSTAALCLYAADFKEDGLWDFAAGDIEGHSAVFTDLAPEPAPVILGSLGVRASQTVRLRVSNPRNLSVENFGYHIPSAKIHRRDTDSDGAIEDVFKDVTLHDGDYIAQVYPAATAAPGATYSLTAEIAGVPLQFARNAFIPQAGNTYPILVYTGATARVSPQTGSFTPNTTPTFDWSHDTYKYPQWTTYTFQLDDNYDFSSPVVSAAGLTEPYYEVTTPLATDTLFYWRYITDYDGVGEYSTVFAINITNCVCPAQGDFDANAAVDALDLARLIDVVFFGAPNEQDITCPSPRADFDCSGLSDVVDLAVMIDHVFFGGAAPCGPCN